MQTLLNSNRGLPSEVENYFDNLDGIWSFDTYLALLAEPFLTQRIHLRIAKELAQYQGYRPKIINTAYHVLFIRRLCLGSGILEKITLRRMLMKISL